MMNYDSNSLEWRSGERRGVIVCAIGHRTGLNLPLPRTELLPARGPGGTHTGSLLPVSPEPPGPAQRAEVFVDTLLAFLIQLFF